MPTWLIKLIPLPRDSAAGFNIQVPPILLCTSKYSNSYFSKETNVTETKNKPWNSVISFGSTNVFGVMSKCLIPFGIHSYISYIVYNIHTMYIEHITLLSTLLQINTFNNCILSMFSHRWSFRVIDCILATKKYNQSKWSKYITSSAVHVQLCSPINGTNLMKWLIFWWPLKCLTWSTLIPEQDQVRVGGVALATDVAMPPLICKQCQECQGVIVFPQTKCNNDNEWKESK